jgi:ribonucleoside-diphosphate reductase alpha chain
MASSDTVVKIHERIVGYHIVAENVVVPDCDPLTLRIKSRPTGSLAAISEKIYYSSNEGKRKVYILVSFMPVDGVINGKPVTIERPVEFFIPSGQLSSEYQWITATMRSLSLAARGGYVTQALRDLRKVVWDKGVIRCGLNQWGKPQYHDSEVAVIAWSIQQILFHRGFLTEDGQQVPVTELTNLRTSESVSGVKKKPLELVKGQTPVGSCPECSNDLYLIDGCPTCITGCGWSKCD